MSAKDNKNNRYNPNNISPGDRVRVFTGRQGWDFEAKVESLTFQEKKKKVIAHLSHNLPGKPLFVDVQDCWSLSYPLYPGHHYNG